MYTGEWCTWLEGERGSRESSNSWLNWLKLFDSHDWKDF